MAGKISDLTAMVSTDVADTDDIEIRDVSTGATGTNKRIPMSELRPVIVPTLAADLSAIQTTAALNDIRIQIHLAAHGNFNVASGGALSPNATPTKLDLAAGVDNIGVFGQNTYAAQTAIATTIASLADATNPKWVVLELTGGDVLQFNQGTAAAQPAFPALTAGRVVHGLLYVPANATNVDTLLSTSNGNAKLIDARVLRPFPNEGRTAVADVPYTCVATDKYVAYTSLSTNRGCTLPAANAVPPGWIITIADESGNAIGGSTLRNISINPAGTDTVNGVAVGTSVETIRDPYGSVTLRSDGNSNWTIIAVEPAVRVEIFTGVGTYTFRPSLVLKRCDMLVISGGGAGGSGEKRATSTNCGGGAGGDSSAVSQISFDASSFSATETVVVGAGGTPGGATTTTGNGASGGNGTTSSVTVGGTVRCRAQPGVGGGGGTAGVGGVASGGQEVGTFLGSAGGNGATGSTSTAATVATNGAGLGAGGGGGGGGCTSSNGLLAASAGGNGAAGLGVGTNLYAVTGGTAAGAAGGAGGVPAAASTGHAWGGGGGGGGGGGRNTTNTTGGDGATGGLYGGGGGGGGNGVGTGNGGNGGAGGAGLVVITSYR